MRTGTSQHERSVVLDVHSSGHIGTPHIHIGTPHIQIGTLHIHIGTPHIHIGLTPRQITPISDPIDAQGFEKKDRGVQAVL
jgi:hypothetical protein